MEDSWLGCHGAGSPGYFGRSWVEISWRALDRVWAVPQGTSFLGLVRFGLACSGALDHSSRPALHGLEVLA